METYLLIIVSLLLVPTVFLTHRITLLYLKKPEKVEEVVEVRYMPHADNAFHIKQEWALDQRMMMGPYPQEELDWMEERAKRDAMQRLWESIPKEMYEYFEYQSFHHGRPEKIYALKLKVLPPVKGYTFNGEYYKKDNV